MLELINDARTEAGEPHLVGVARLLINDARTEAGVGPVVLGDSPVAQGLRRRNAGRLFWWPLGA